MKTALKKICIFSLAAGVGLMVKSQISDPDNDYFKDTTQDEKDIIQDCATDISIAGEYALDNCGVKIDRSRFRQAGKKVDEVKMNGEEFDIVETLSFLLAGLTDMIKDWGRYENIGARERIKAVQDAALNFLCVYDPNIEMDNIHAIAAAKYEEWVK
jgi:hypothetical protein